MDNVRYTINPFPGIRSFEQDEDYLFFGRDQQISNILNLLSRTKFVALIGYSGSGKSSLIKAGIIPSIAKDKMQVGLSNEWTVIYFRPGDNPFVSFTAALVNAVNDDYDPEDGVADSILSRVTQARDMKEVYTAFDRGQSKNWFIVIDQFEELFRFNRAEAEQERIEATQQFVDLMLSNLDDPEVPVYTMISMRSDFLDHSTEYNGLPEAFNRGSYILPKIQETEIREIIEKPIAICGAKISPALVDLLLNNIEDDLDQLPILQHALMRTWDYWRQSSAGDDTLQVSHYQAIGSIATALSVHAEEIYNNFPKDGLKIVTEKVFKALTDVTVDNKGTRRPVPLKELVELAGYSEHDVVEVIQAFREPGRAFLMPNYKQPLYEDTIIDITHESIMRVWNRLKEWVQEEAKSAELYMRLSKAAEQYQHGETGLWTNPDLALALQWQQAQKPNASWADRYNPYFDRTINFLDYSKRQTEIEISQKENKQKRDLRRARRTTAIGAGVAIVSLLLLMFSYSENRAALASAKQAKLNEKYAKLSSAQAIEEKKEAVLQERIAAQQQQITEEEKLVTEAQKSNALKQQKIAESKTVEAVEQRQKAQSAEGQAVLAKNEALTQKSKAVVAQQEAVSGREEAERQRIKAVGSETNAQRLRVLSVARTIAIQSEKLPTTENYDLTALLALQSYNFMREKKGFENEHDVFNALSRVADPKPILRSHGDAVRGIDLSADGRTMISCGDDATVKVWQGSPETSYKLIRQLPMGDARGKDVRCVAVSRDGEEVAAGTVDGRILFWKLGQKELHPVIMPAAHASIINKIHFSANSDVFVTAGSDGYLKAWNSSALQAPVMVHNLQSPVLSLATSGNRLACGTLNGSVYLFSSLAAGTAPAVTFKASGDAIYALAFDGPGNTLGAGTAGGNIRLYDLAGGKAEPRTFKAHSSAINAISFNNNGTFASCSYDRSIRIWTLAALNETPITIDDYDSWVMDLKYVPGGKRLIAAGADRTIRIFNVSQPDMAAIACDKIKHNLTNEEWNTYIGADISYEKTCPDKP